MANGRDLSNELRRNAILAKRIGANKYQGNNKCCGIRGRALHIIRDNPGIAQKSLAEIMGVRPQTLGETIVKLEADGLIERRTNDYDKRIQSLFVTKKAEPLFCKPDSEINKNYSYMDESFLSQNELDQLVDLLQKLNTSIEGQLESK